MAVWATLEFDEYGRANAADWSIFCWRSLPACVRWWELLKDYIPWRVR